MSDHQAFQQSFRQALYRELGEHRLIATGMAVAILVVLILLLASSISQIGQATDSRYNNALLGGLGGFISTAIGAFMALFLQKLKARTEDTLLGFAAGMMLAASCFSLILPALDAAGSVISSELLAVVIVILGLALGVMLMLGLDRFTPHEHENEGPCGPGCQRIGRVWLFVLAITLHNLPEGMAIGVSFGANDLSVGLPLTAAIFFQNIPEGLAVALALRAAYLTPLNAALVAAATGLMEPLGALLGIGISGGLALAYPIGLGLAAGAMIFVVSHEVIPETHRNGNQTYATLGLMGGFAAMLLLDTLLG